MSEYETLINKANACREAAKRTSGLMSAIWQAHAERLEAKADALSLEQAKRKGAN